VPADAASLPVVGHQNHGGSLEPAALLQEVEEVADVAIGLGELLEVLGAAHPAHVSELVGGEQLEHEQVGVLFLHDAATLRRERAVDLRRGLHRGHRADHLLAERVEQVGYAHEAAAAAAALQNVED
jgi:hypothetical protein